MIQLTYKLSPTWNKKMKEIDLRKVSEISLRYDMVLGDLIFTIDSQDFSALWEWVPLLDFAASLTAIVSQLERGASEGVFEFTESEATLNFVRKNAHVLLSSNYTDAEARVQLAVLRDAVEKFRASLTHEVIREYPQLQENEAFSNLMLRETNKGTSPNGGSGV